MANEIIATVINLVFNSERRMPAHFTSSDTKSQTFLVDFNDIPADVEYEMASEVWHRQPAISPKPIQIACVKIAEDIMVGSYILTKLGHGEETNYFMNEMINFNISAYPKEMHEELKHACDTREIKEYFNYCRSFGANIVT